MTVCFITNIVSPHQLPFAAEMAMRLGLENFRYVATEPFHGERSALGWAEAAGASWILQHGAAAGQEAEIASWVDGADVLLSDVRDLDMIERRVKAGKTTMLMTERWFKPPFGMLRLLHPRYLGMGLRLKKLLCSPYFNYLPMGVHAARDVHRLIRLLSGDLRCLFGMSGIAPVTYEPLAPFMECAARPACRVGEEPRRKAAGPLSKIRIWAYFVAPSEKSGQFSGQNEEIGIREGTAETYVRTGSCMKEPFRILWVGRMLNWKRVDTLIRAAGILLADGRRVHLKLVGHGPEETRLRKLANGINNRQQEIVLKRETSKGKRCANFEERVVPQASSLEIPVSASPTNPLMDSRTNELGPITFHPPVPIAEVRRLMREADVYVLPSNGCEGWGAVVNEAMEEGCPVVATRDSGAGATLIRDDETGLLFRSGNAAELSDKIRRLMDDPESARRIRLAGQASIRARWSPSEAAGAMVAFCEQRLGQ